MSERNTRFDVSDVPPEEQLAEETSLAQGRGSKISTNRLGLTFGWQLGGE